MEWFQRFRRDDIPVILHLNLSLACLEVFWCLFGALNSTESYSASFSLSICLVQGLIRHKHPFLISLPVILNLNHPVAYSKSLLYLSLNLNSIQRYSASFTFLLGYRLIRIRFMFMCQSCCTLIFIQLPTQAIQCLRWSLPQHRM